MNMHTLSGIMTAILLVIFIALFFWAFSKKRQGDFDEAANLPFVGDDEDPRIVTNEGIKKEESHE